MKVIDERGKLFGKISVIDIAVLIIVALLLAAAYMKFNVIQVTSPSVETTRVTYTAEIRNIRESNALLLREGDKVWTESGTPVGKIIKVEYQPATQTARLVDGTVVKAGIEGKVDVFLTVEASCTDANGRVFIERTFELARGRDYVLRTKYQIWSGMIIDFEKDTDGAA